MFADSGFWEIISAVWLEMSMFGLAVIVYLVVTGALTKVKSQGKAAKCSKYDLSPKFTPSGVKKDHSEQDVHDIARALSQDRVMDAVSGLAKLTEARAKSLPLQMLVNLLTALATTEDAKDVLVKLSGINLKGRFNTRALEGALIDLVKQDLPASRNLILISELLVIPQSVRCWKILVKAHASDRVTIKMLADSFAYGDHSGLLKKPLALEVLFACRTLKDTEVATLAFKAASLTSDKAPDSDLCAAMVDVYMNCGLHTEVCNLYEEVIQPSDMQVDSSLGDALVTAATQVGRCELVESIVQSLPTDMAKEARRIRMCGKDGDLQAALDIFQKHVLAKRPLTPLLYNAVLEASVQCGDMTTASTFLERAKEQGLADVVSYNTVMKGNLAAGSMESAQDLLQEMSEAGLPANRITYHELLNDYVTRANRKGAWSIVQQMHASGLEPNSVTCSILLKSITAKSHAADLDRICQFMDAMEKAMDEVLFSSLVEACVRTERLRTLTHWMQIHPTILTQLSAATYGSMIKAFGQAHDVDQVKALWEDMNQRNVKPTSVTTGCLVEALVMNHCTDYAWEVVQHLLKDENKCSLVNTVIYSTILKGFAMAKQPKRVMELYAEMKNLGISCNTITYNTILNAFAQSGTMHSVPQLLEDMRSAQPPVEPDIVTYSTLVKGYCMCGDLDRALQLMQDMKKGTQCAPDEVLYNSLLDGCAKQQRLQEALNLLDDMRDAHIVPSNFTLSILIKLLGRTRRLSQAFSMMETLCKEHGLRPNIQVYTCLMQACIHNRSLGKALALHDQIIREGCRPDEKFYSALVRGCLQSGAYDKVVEVIRCAYHLPGHPMQQAHGNPVGVEAKCMEEVMGKLDGTSDVVKQLKADLQDVKFRSKGQGSSKGKGSSKGSSKDQSTVVGKGGNLMMPWRQQK